jgi:hypothetical protein
MESGSNATKNYVKDIIVSIQNYQKEKTRENELIKRACLSIIASKLIQPEKF